MTGLAHSCTRSYTHARTQLSIHIEYFVSRKGTDAVKETDLLKCSQLLFTKMLHGSLRRFQNKAACHCYLGLATENAVSIQALPYPYVCNRTYIHLRCTICLLHCLACVFQCNSSRQHLILRDKNSFCSITTTFTHINYPPNPLIILTFFNFFYFPKMHPPFFLFLFSVHSLWPSQDSCKSKWYLICMHLQNIACAVFAVKGIKKRVLVGVYVLPHWHQTALWYGNRRTGKEWLLTEALFGCRPKSIPSFLHLSIYSYPSLFSHTFLLPFMCRSLSP